MLTRKILEIHQSESELSEDVRAALVASLYGPVASLVVGAVSGIVIVVLAAIHAHSAPLTGLAFATLIVGTARVLSAIAYRHRPRPESPRQTRRWERIYQIGAYCWSGLLGLNCAAVLLTTQDATLHVIVATMTAGYAAGITGRNAGRPIIAISQLMLAALPLAFGLMFNGSSLYMVLGVVILLFIYGMTDITLSIRDIIVQALVTTSEKAALAERFETQAKRFDAALNNMSHGLCMFDRDNRLLVWNRQFSELFGLGERDVGPGLSAREILSRSMKLGDTAQNSRVVEELKRLSSGFVGEAQLSDGRVIALWRRMMLDGGSVIIFEDISERKAQQERIVRMARYDDLTELPNRTSFRERIDQGLRATRQRRRGLALHLIDLDRFKAVNDTLGHPVGDRLLHAVADRLKAALRVTDNVSRLGGDEFVVVQTPVRNAEAAANLASRLVTTLSAPYEIDGHLVHIGGSIGIAVAPNDGLNADKLLKSADMALYAAKADGGGSYRFFEPEMEAAAHQRRLIELDLRKALANGEFELFYQPMIELATGRVSGCEALIRWRHPDRGLVSPAEFIPILEETGLIVQIGEWILLTACTEALSWPGSPNVSVNLSPVQFKDPNFAMRVIGALGRSGLTPSRLELEITETVLLQDSTSTLAAMRHIQELGARISLDDFGTGYSSLSYLRKFPFSKIKIDGSFVRDIGQGNASLAIIRAIAGMGHSLGMSIVVEGLETAEQVDLVRAEGCGEGQGYFLSKPMPASEIRKFLQEMENRRRVA